MAAARGLRTTRLLARQCVKLTQARLLTEAAMPAPSSEASKMYPEHVVKIVDQISQLTLIETAELNELLKVRLKIPDTPMMAMGAMPMAQPAQQGEEAEEVKEAQTEFTIKLTGFDDGGKIKLIKEVKNLVDGMNLVQAKKFVESVPQVLREDISKDEAEKLKTQLEALGGKVEIE